ncbi:MAG TPA: DUF1003 domain-containing protein [Pyrinomonadaceae bacterium]|nr:DUF1003 domain-containing protein [Pyrinomonadaceae bacterium]
MSSEVMSQSEIMRKNISAVAQMQRKVSEARTLQGRIADLITEFSGSMAFVYLHAIWFSVWILLNVGLIQLPYVSEFDPYPFGLLTLIVSLEAIFLATFVLISQNRLAEASERRAELDLQVNLLAEQKATKVLEMLDQITRQLDGMGSRFNFVPDPEVEALKVSPEPQEVLQVIEETVKDETEDVKEEVGKAVKDITGETEAIKQKVDEAVDEITGEVEGVRTDVKRTSGKLEEVASEVQEIKQEVKAKEETGEHERLSLK